MRKLIIFLWLLLPFGMAAYHYGPGQERLVLDEVGVAIAQAEAHAAKEEWYEAEEFYNKALELIPVGEKAMGQRVRLERAKAQMFVSKLPTAHDELERLVDDLEAEAGEPELLDDARETLANAKYYMTWLMRLEGQPREKWEPVIEAARQNYRLLAEKADKGKQVESAKSNRENLEASIRLARMDLKDLQGLPLPSQ